jgi:hypothetical protein
VKEIMLLAAVYSIFKYYLSLVKPYAKYGGYFSEIGKKDKLKNFNKEYNLLEISKEKK